MLKNFDIAVAHAPSRIVYQIKKLPESFPEMNTGVILFKSSHCVNLFFQEWLNIYNRDMKKETTPPTINLLLEKLCIIASLE